jgi:hypothetical protein
MTDYYGQQISIGDTIIWNAYTYLYVGIVYNITPYTLKVFMCCGSGFKPLSKPVTVRTKNFIRIEKLLKDY